MKTFYDLLRLTVRLLALVNSYHLPLPPERDYCDRFCIVCSRHTHCWESLCVAASLKNWVQTVHLTYNPRILSVSLILIL